MRASSWPRSRPLSHGMAPKGPFQCRQTHVSRSALNESHSLRLHVGSTMAMLRPDSGSVCAKGKFSSPAGETIRRTQTCVQETGISSFTTTIIERAKLYTKLQTDTTTQHPDHHLNEPPRNARHSGSTQSRDAVGRSTRTAARRRRRAQCASSAGTRCTRPRAPRRASRQAAPPRSSAPPGRHGRASTSAARSGPWATRGSSAGHRAGSPHSPVSSSTTRTEPL